MRLAKPFTEGDFKAVVGRWTGRFGRSPSEHVFIIRYDRTFVETRADVVSVGSLQIRGGVIVFTGSHTRGQLQLHEDGANRLLVGDGEVTSSALRMYIGDNGTYAIELEPAR